MDENKLFGSRYYESFRLAMKAQKGRAMGTFEDQMNAALAMFLTAPRAVQKEWGHRVRNAVDTQPESVFEAIKRARDEEREDQLKVEADKALGVPEVKRRKAL